MEGKFTFRNIIELKNLRPLSENSAHKKNATSTRFMVQNIPVCSFDIVIFLEFHSTKQGLPLVDSWSRGLD